MFGQPFFIPSVLIALLALPLSFGWIPRQGFYGVRTRKTLANDEAWYPANRLAGALLVASSTVYLVAAWYMPDPTTVTSLGLVIWIVHLGAFVIPLVISLIVIRDYVRRL